MEHRELTAGGLRLRPWLDSDAPVVVRAYADPDIALWNGSPVYSLDDAHAWVRRMTDWSDSATFAVVDGETDSVLGYVSLHKIDSHHCGAEIGYWVLPEARGRQVGARAVDAVCRWAFSDLGLRRIELCHAVENSASGRVAERAGFTREGRLRAAYRYGDGKLHDELLWARLAEDRPPTF